MMRTKRRIMLQTTVAIFLSINVHVTRDQTHRLLLTIPILPLTLLLAWSWSLTDTIIRLLEQIGQNLDSFQQRLSVGLILLTIGCRSVLYGAGVRL